MDIQNICRQLLSIRHQLTSPSEENENLTNIATELSQRSRNEDEVEVLCKSGRLDGLVDVVKEKPDDVVTLSVLSFMANCANVSAMWRTKVKSLYLSDSYTFVHFFIVMLILILVLFQFYEEGGIQLIGKLVSFLNS